jgi:hypothetical protein
MVKREIRILGIDDAPFSKKDKNVLAVGSVFRGGNYMDGLISFKVQRDGNDSTEKIIRAVKKTKHRRQIQCIMIDGLALGGFNLVDIQELQKKTKMPVIVTIRKMPDMAEIEKALRAARLNVKEKMGLMKKAGRIYRMKVKGRDLFLQLAGIDLRKARNIISISATHSLIPEPLRISHLIASGIIKGESKGRA